MFHVPNKHRFKESGTDYHRIIVLGIVVFLLFLITVSTITISLSWRLRPWDGNIFQLTFVKQEKVKSQSAAQPGRKCAILKVFFGMKTIV